MSGLYSNSTVLIKDTLPANATTVQILEHLRHKVSLYSGMVPNVAFNISMIAIWGVLLTIQVLQLYYRQWWFSIAFICTGVLEVLGYIGRTWSHYNLPAMNPFLLNMVCLTIAPVFTMGGIYYQLAKLIEIYGHRFSLLPSPMAYSFIFIASDIISLAIQAAGGGTAGMAVRVNKSAQTGDNIFVAGLAIQVASMFFFLLFWFQFLFRIYIQVRFEHTNTKKITKQLLMIRQSEIDYLYREKFHDLRIDPDRWVFRYFTLAMTAAVLCIFTRCCYRLAELSEGWSGYLITHEWYFIILDALMMTLATTIFTIFHPGFAFKGKYTSIPITTGHVDPETRSDNSFDDDLENNKLSVSDIEKEVVERFDKKPKTFFKKMLKNPFKK
ncbi:phospholipid-translocating ATPase RSB1 NDAI_0F00580 [Naumovozyma dairenensis CBS 421]|uniref:Sphingoid long-chain base transporter RSB1 n=1 Tax=Naumovozyma dairenensis (strain ATCC 10597 / BCRC 20456 / CBS 421 / NBRC 0211 / NRRL Y-12639) TaxID=1071378 RepID=G0WC66_NAUDC|nr:hypothetical protein NDAI_0F00580 [Naumovozyma dairenensis CBS 421]CCD25377.1 hypothetical protein NDAI_0F00580 [Naumovozyma dairenensis CBS 421]